MTKLTWAQVTGWRMKQQYLLECAEADQWLKVVQRICGLHAQVMSAGELIAAVRVKGLPPDAVKNALWQDRTLIKTWSLRGTLHLITAADFPLYVGALSTNTLHRRPVWEKYYKVNHAEMDAIMELVGEILTDTGMTRETLANKLAEHTGNHELAEQLRSGWGTFFKPIAFSGRLCFGESDGQKVTFVQPQRWIGAWTPLDSQTALAEMLRRYLTAYAPATLQDFALWSGFAISTAKKLFKALEPELEQVEIDDWQGWALTETIPVMQKQQPAGAVRLLPYFDPYTIGSTRNCDYILPAEHKLRVYRSQGWISPVVLVDGQMLGVWDTERKRGRINLLVEMFKPVDKTIRAGIEAEAARLSEFMGSEIDVIYAG